MVESHVESATPTQEPAALESNQKTEIKNPDAVVAKNRELLAEKRRLQEQLDELREFKTSTEIERKEKKGEFIEVISSLKEEIKTLKGEIKERDTKGAYKTLKNQVSKEAEKLGCKDSDMFFEMAMTKYGKEFATVEYDKEGEAYSSEDVRDVVEKLKSNIPYMFGADSVNHTPATMVNGVTSKKKSLSEMSSDELTALWKQME